MESQIDRLNSLERSQQEIRDCQDEILSILTKIENRLVGDIENDKPGLIDEVRTVRTIVESLDTRLESIEKANIINRIDVLESTVKDMKRKLESLNKYRFISFGIFLVVVFILEHGADVVALFFGKKP